MLMVGHSSAMPSSRPKIRTHLAPIVAAVLLGVATSLAVAWIAAARVDNPDQMRGRRGERSFGQTADGRPLLLEIMADDPVGVSFSYGRIRVSGVVFDGKHPTPEAVARRWERGMVIPWVDGSAVGSAGYVATSVKAAGWPWRCVWCEVHGHNATAPPGGHDYLTPGGVAIHNVAKPGWADWPPDYPTIIRLRPIWPEFAADVAVCVGFWGVVIGGCRFTRRWLRCQRGLCAECGYDLRGLSGVPCPECGRRMNA
jgi:hypothetical protein